MTDNWNLIGHNWAVDMLRRHIATGEVRHAYLFAGSPGLGRRSLALSFACALNCADPPAPGEACGACRDCRQIKSMRHPDMAVVQAEKEGGVLKVEQVRDVKRTVSLKPFQANYRVALFLRFQEANDSAANALLKTLEEAPDHAILLLTADTTESLLPTIVSRCEVLRLRPLSIERIVLHLRSLGADEGVARLIAHISGGRPGYALNLLEDKSMLEVRKTRLEDLRELLSASRVEKFAYAEKLAKDREAMRQTLVTWLSFWRDVLLRAAEADAPLANIDRMDEIESLAGKLSLPGARQHVAENERAIQLMERNINARLLAEVLLLGW